MSKFFEAVNKMDPLLADPTLASAEPPAAAPTWPPPPPPAPDLRTSAPPRRPPVAAITREFSARLSPGSPVLPFDGSDEMAAERYRIIRTRLFHDPRRPKLLCVSSSGMGDGKSVTATNIAGALALKTDTRVLLVDSDFRRSTLANILGAPQEPGLSEVLSGTVDWRDAVSRMKEARNLYFIPAGQQTESPAELLDSARWTAACNTFREHFDFVVIDSPPMGIVADYDLIQSTCDGVILVARQDHSDRKRLRDAIESVPKERLIGVVLNCVTPWALWKAADDYPRGGRYGYKIAFDEGQRPASAGPSKDTFVD
jgi:capsular exopolysaccharide synthesis family protein